jgi:hypothetical protein
MKGFAQLQLFPSPLRFPILLGQVRETNDFYAGAASQVMHLFEVSNCASVSVSINRHGKVVIDSADRVDVRMHVLTVNHKTDPDFLAEALMAEAILRGFDDGVRKGRRGRRDENQ